MNLDYIFQLTSYENLDKMLGLLEVKKLTIAKMSVHVLVPV